MTNDYLEMPKVKILSMVDNIGVGLHVVNGRAFATIYRYGARSYDIQIGISLHCSCEHCEFCHDNPTDGIARRSDITNNYIVVSIYHRHLHYN